MTTIKAPLPADDLTRDLKRRADPHNRALEGEVHHTPVKAVGDDLSAKRTAFLARTAKLHLASQGRRQTPSELLIGEDRDHGH